MKGEILKMKTDKNVKSKYLGDKLDKIQKHFDCNHTIALKIFKLLDRKVYLLEKLIEADLSYDRDISLDEFRMKINTKTNTHSLLVFIVFCMVIGREVDLDIITPLLQNVEVDDIMKLADLMPLLDCEYIYENRLKYVIRSNGAYLGEASILALLANTIRFKGCNLIEEMKHKGVFKILLEDFHVGNLCTFGVHRTRAEVMVLIDKTRIQNKELLFNSLSGSEQFQINSWDAMDRVISSAELNLEVVYHHDSDDITIEYNDLSTVS